MSIRETKFNHEENNFHLAIGINEETKNICRERIFFTSFSNSLQADELFDDIDVEDLDARNLISCKLKIR